MAFSVNVSNQINILSQVFSRSPQRIIRQSGNPSEQLFGHHETQTFPTSVSFLAASACTFTHLFLVLFSSAASSCSAPYSTGWAKFACKYLLSSGSYVALLCLIRPFSTCCVHCWHFFSWTSKILAKKSVHIALYSSFFWLWGLWVL